MTSPDKLHQSILGLGQIVFWAVTGGQFSCAGMIHRHVFSNLPVQTRTNAPGRGASDPYGLEFERQTQILGKSVEFPHTAAGTRFEA